MLLLLLLRGQRLLGLEAEVGLLLWHLELLLARDVLVVVIASVDGHHG